MSVLALASVGAFAATVNVYQGVQGPSIPSTNPPNFTPPALRDTALLKSQQFARDTLELGRNEFEAGNPLVSGFQGGTATIVGGAVVDGSDPLHPVSLGRYNMSPGVPEVDGFNPGPGHWLEATEAFTMQLSTAVNAFSMFVTDLGDYSAAFTLTFKNATSGMTWTTDPLVNDAANPANGDTNGNLMFFGVLLDFAFDTVTFNVSQSPVNRIDPLTGNLITDVLGFDSFVFATARGGNNVPEPGSLALAGLALAGLGAVSRRRAVR